MADNHAPKTPKRKKELTSKDIDVFVRALDAPDTFAVAANIAGYSERTLRAWIATGQHEDCDDDLLLELAQKYAQAMGGQTSRRAQLMRQAVVMAEDDVKMMQFVLKALNPEMEPAKSIKLEATVEPKASRIDYSKLTVEEAKLLQQSELIKLRLME